MTCNYMYHSTQLTLELFLTQEAALATCQANALLLNPRPRLKLWLLYYKPSAAVTSQQVTGRVRHRSSRAVHWRRQAACSDARLNSVCWQAHRRQWEQIARHENFTESLTQKGTDFAAKYVKRRGSAQGSHFWGSRNQYLKFGPLFSPTKVILGAHFDGTIFLARKWL